jgi:hypothetical protein
MKLIFKFAFVAAMAVAVAACGPRGNRHDQNNNQPNQSMSQDFGGKHHGGKLRRICANDIQKLCSGQQKVRRCLRDNSDKLEPACNTALQQAIERRRERKMQKMNNTNNTQGQQPTQQNGMQPQNPATPQNGMQPQNQTNGQHANQSDDDDDDDN